VSWVRIDDQLHAHPKINQAWATAPEAVGFYLLALSYSGCYLTDGRLDPAFIEQKLPDPRRREATLAALTTFDLLHVAEGDGYQIHDYLDHNPSRKQVKAERERKAKAGRKGAKERWRNPAPDAASEAGAIAGTNGGRDAPVPVPIPTPLETAPLALDVPEDSEVLLIREVTARMNEAALQRNIEVDARLIERAIKDHRHAPPAEVRLAAFKCADWLAHNAPRNGGKPRSAHLTLRKFFRDLPQPREEQRERRYTHVRN